MKKELYPQWLMDILLTQRYSEDILYALAQKIDEQPTAYDPDKVVKQLEELTDEMEQFNCTGMLSDIIEVVKAGGVNG